MIMIIVYFSGLVLKSVYVTALCMSLISIQSAVFANKKTIFENIQLEHSNQIKMNQYAQPCEAILPQSEQLKAIQNKIAQSPQERKKLLNQFWDHAKGIGTPLIEPIDGQNSRMIFLWRGAEHNVRLIGGPSNDHEWLTRLPDTDIWFKESLVDNRFIGSYSYAVDLPNLDGYLSHYCPQLNSNLKESRVQRRASLQVQKIDPLNTNAWFQPQSKTISNDATQKKLDELSQKIKLRSENIVSLSQSPQFIDPSLYPNHPNPKLKHFILKSKIMGNERIIQTYQSKKKNPNDSYITAIFFDGKQYSELLNVPKALDILVESGQLPPIQAVFVSHPSDTLRPQELTPNKAYTQFFIDELMPFIDQKLPNRDRSKTVILGSSLGGLSSAYMAMQFPQQISHVVPLSGSFWWQKDSQDVPNSMSKIIRESANQSKQQWFISANTYETSKNNNDLSILETSEIVANDLKKQGHQVHYQNYVGGHSYAVWQMILQDALLHFFAQNHQ